MAPSPLHQSSFTSLKIGLFMSRHTVPRKQNGPRKRSGCITCKLAHVKCTEERPRCGRCNRLKLGCRYEFTLLWEEDAVQRGIVHGRVGVWSKVGKKTAAGEDQIDESRSVRWYKSYPAVSAVSSNWNFVNFGVDDFLDGVPQALFSEHNEPERCDQGSSTIHVLIAPERQAEETFDCHTDEGLALIDNEEIDEEFGIPLCESTCFLHEIENRVPPMLANFALSSLEAQLMDYYIRTIAPVCSLSVDTNPYLGVLIPVAYDFAPLRYTLFAAAACQLFHVSGTNTFQVHSLWYRSKAIRALYRYLKRHSIDWKSLATMAMFCFRDITDGCEPSWITHLAMGLRMLKDLSCSSKADSDLQNFCEIYFGSHQVMGRTGWDEDDKQIDVYEWGVDERYREINAIVGCSRELLSLISRVSSLAADLQYGTAEAAEQAVRARSILEQINSLKQYPGELSRSVLSMVQVAETKRLSALLYFHNRIGPYLSSATFSTALLPPAEHIQGSIISSLRNFPPSSGASLWPLFVLGRSRLREASQACFVLDRMAQLETSRYLGSVYHARRRVERDIGLTYREGQHGERLALIHKEPVSENERWVSLA